MLFIVQIFYEEIDFNACFGTGGVLELKFLRILPGVQCCGVEFCTHCRVLALERLWLVLCPT